MAWILIKEENEGENIDKINDMIDKFDKAQKKVFDTYYNNLHTGIKKL